MNLLDNELVRRIEELERQMIRTIKCQCDCEGCGGPHECSCLPNVKHRHDQFQPEKRDAEKLLDEIEKEVAERDYGEWGKQLKVILAKRKPPVLANAPEKCPHYGYLNCGHKTLGQNCKPSPAPVDPVEEIKTKILYLARRYGYGFRSFEEVIISELESLVTLARKDSR